MHFLSFSVVLTLTCVYGSRPENDLPLARKIRQTFGNTAGPNLVQVLSRLPIGNTQEISSCFQLNGQLAPAESQCSFVPNLWDSAGKVVSCRLLCSGNTDQFAGVLPSQSLANILPADALYLQNGQFQILGQNDLNIFSGVESFFLIPNPTTTSGSPLTTTATTSPALGSTTTTTTVANTVTVPQPAAVPQRAVAVVESQLQGCYNSTPSGPAAGCTFNPDGCASCCRPASCQFSPDLKQLADCFADPRQGLSDGASFDNGGTASPLTCTRLPRPFQPGTVLPEQGLVVIAGPPTPTSR
ncbi:hypothetical protein RvY_12288 [Ramazzottius varieornatus]|uniref:Tectonic domain-containing protein n=1 Tax=Ramazzottius varieornatus TaxID=947166 RepID=A0A1D1VJ23_RAMVA|nr:hypothetical protein RvY_12288 [Ramazzottius varieornatus]